MDHHSPPGSYRGAHPAPPGSSSSYHQLPPPHRSPISEYGGASGGSSLSNMKGHHKGGHGGSSSSSGAGAGAAAASAGRRYAPQHPSQHAMEGPPPSAYNHPEWAHEAGPPPPPPPHHWRHQHPSAPPLPPPSHQQQQQQQHLQHHHQAGHRHDSYEPYPPRSPPGRGHSRTHSREVFLPPPLPPTMGPTPIERHSPAMRFEPLKVRPKNGRASPPHHADWAAHQHEQQQHHKRKRSENFDQYGPIERPGWDRPPTGYSNGYPAEHWGAPPAVPLRDREREREHQRERREREREEDFYRQQQQQQQKQHLHQQQQHHHHHHQPQVAHHRPASKHDRLTAEAEGRAPSQKSHKRTPSADNAKSRTKMPPPPQSPSGRMLPPLTSPYGPPQVLPPHGSRPTPEEIAAYEHQQQRMYCPPPPMNHPDPHREEYAMRAEQEQHRRLAEDAMRQRTEAYEREREHERHMAAAAAAASARGHSTVHPYDHPNNVPSHAPEYASIPPAPASAPPRRTSAPKSIASEYEAPRRESPATGHQQGPAVPGGYMELLPPQPIVSRNQIHQPLHPSAPPSHQSHFNGSHLPSSAPRHRIINDGVWQWLDELRAGGSGVDKSVGAFSYEAWKHPLLPAELLAIHVGATVEVRISGALLGLYRETSEAGAASGWTLGWRARQHGCKVDFPDQKVVDAPQEARKAQAGGPEFWSVRGLAERKLWGSEVYTDDSDIVAMCVHSGWIEGPSKMYPAIPKRPNEGSLFYSPPDLRVTLRVAPRLVGYQESFGGGLWSRNWLGIHDGVSLLVEAVALEKPGWADKANLPGSRGTKHAAAHSNMASKKLAALSLLDEISGPTVGPAITSADKTEGPEKASLSALLTGRTAKQSVFPLSDVRRVEIHGEKDAANSANAAKSQHGPEWYRLDRWAHGSKSNFIAGKA